MTANPLAPEWLTPPSDLNRLNEAIWPRTARRDEAGTVEIGGVPVTKLAEQYGTPLYVMDEHDLRSRARETRDAFVREFEAVGSTAKVYYAGKAFLSTIVAQWVVEEGLHIDVASGGELAVALAAGVDPALLGLHGNNKSRREIDRAVSVGVGVIVLDSPQEVDLVAQAASAHGVRQRVRLRVNSGVHASTHDYLATAREDQKFGIALPDAAATVARIRSFDSLEFVGLHAHIGSQIFEVEGFGESARRLMTLQAELLADGPVPELNLGGGFGIAYTEVDRARPIGEIAAGLARIVADEAERLGIPVPVVAVEPGRSIVGPSTVTLYEVGITKDVLVQVPGEEERSAVRRYVSIDGGMSDNLRPALYGANYTVRLAGRASASDPQLVRLAGKHCESGDIVVDADYLPADTTAGDIVAVAATGAYCWALSSNYNYLTRPAVVAVRDGESRVIVRGETEDDLLARDAGIASTSGADATKNGMG